MRPLIPCGVAALLLSSACVNEATMPLSAGVAIESELTRGCLGSYELTGENMRDTINRVYGFGVKDGHWIDFAYFVKGTKPGPAPSGKAVNGMIRVKLQEGWYNNNRKTGVWRTYDQDGTVIDSVYFKSEFPSDNPC
jgi:hypothetical protein